MAAALTWGSFAVLLVIVTVSDRRTRLIPDRALILAAAIAAATLALAAPAAAPGRLAAAALAGGFMLVAALARPGGIGLGDVKLAAVLGLYLGRAIVPAILIAFAGGALWGLGMIVAHGWSARTRTIAFAPFLATGAAVARLAADNVDPWS